MADRLTVTDADRSEIQKRIDQSLNYILNGPGAFWPEGGSRPLQEIVSNLAKYRLSLPRVEDINDPDGVYRSTLNDLDDKMRGFGKKLKAAGKFPDDLDVLPPFPDDHIEVRPPSTFFPKPSPKDLLNQFNNPISLQPGVAAAPDGAASPPLQPDAPQDAADNGPTRFLARRTYDRSQGSPFQAQPAPAPASPDGSLSINDAYLEYLKRLNAA
ncbi:hypothetical protein [Bradyrhizobium sp.]|uniref:hypothetical protein n=1 Tax=Bradyrhizobium sp. TaxID=376 RepID=UPI00262B9A91|nr:hypothetical protein [Bradyrhizobium sp.]